MTAIDWLRRAVAVTFLAACFTAGTLTAHAATTPAGVRLCNHPGAGPAHKPYITYGVTRIRDNAWAGPSAKRFCLTIGPAGRWVRVDTAAVAYGGNVVAYPSSETGPFFTWPDLQTGLPERAGDLRQLTFHVKSNCTAPGGWLADVDSYYRPRADWTSHGTFELVVANCWSGGSAGGQLVRIHGVAYRFRHWITSDPSTGLRWPIAVFRQVRQTRSASVMVGRFTWWLRRHHLLPADAGWYQDGAYGPEIWSGAKGLRFSCRITGLPPVIVPLHS